MGLFSNKTKSEPEKKKIVFRTPTKEESKILENLTQLGVDIPKSYFEIPYERKTTEITQTVRLYPDAAKGLVKKANLFPADIEEKYPWVKILQTDKDEDLIIKTTFVE